MFKRILTALMICVLSACSTTPLQPIVITKHIVVTPDDALLIDCDVEPPPSKDAFLIDYSGAKTNLTNVTVEQVIKRMQDAVKTAQERELMLYNMNMKQMANLFKCNIQKKALRDWKATIDKTVLPDSTGQ